MSKTLPQCSHITRKRGVYYYRRRLPGGAAGEIALSLKTGKFQLAACLSAGLDDAFQEFFSTIEMPTFDITGTLRTYLRERREKLRQKHLTTPYGVPIHNGRPNADQRPIDADLEAINHAIRQMYSDLRRRDIRPVDPIAERLIDGRSVTDAERVELSLGLLRGEIQLLEQSREWISGGLVDEIELSEPVAQAPLAITDTSTTVQIVDDGAAHQAAKLSEVLPAFISFMTKDEGWCGQTLAQNQATYRMFIQCCGDRPVTSYKRSDLTRFYDTLRGLPALYAKKKVWRGKPITAIAEETADLDVDRLAMQTVKRHMTALSRFFRYLKRRGEYDGENPAQGFEFPKKGRARDNRAMWQGEALQKRFDSPIWKGCLSASRRSTPGAAIIQDEKYWLPLLGLYHGNRLEEFCQLIRSDVRTEDGICYLDINDEEGKQLKNEQSRRRVPLHPKLHALGFLDYVTHAAPNPTDRLFPQLQPGGPDRKLGFYFSKWRSRYRQNVGIYAKGLDYHSFRGGVTTKLVAAGVSLEFRNELLGHEGTSTDERVYVKGVPIQQLYEAICKVEWPEIDATFAATGDSRKRACCVTGHQNYKQ